MTIPTVCYLVTTRKGFHPEKAIDFGMCEKLANKKVVDAHHHLTECIIMPKETFEELCPDWADSQDFVGEIPKDGYYWYVDKEYPSPCIGLVHGGKFFNETRGESSRFVGKHYFIGPKIEAFPPQKVKIVE